MTRLATLYAVAILIAAPALAAQSLAPGASSVPPGQRPPAGMCRIWIDGVPASRQPAPTDCPTAIRRRPPNARVIFGDDSRAPLGDLRAPASRGPRREERPRTEKKEKDRRPPLEKRERDERRR